MKTKYRDGRPSRRRIGAARNRPSKAIGLAAGLALWPMWPLAGLAAEPERAAAAEARASSPAPAAATAASAEKAQAQPEAATASGLPLVRTRARPLAEHGGIKTFDARQLRDFPGANGDLGALLRLSPQVQFDNAQRSALTQGEIAPADLSINGAKFYQNLFLLDGLSLNNDLDPGSGNPLHFADVPGAPQGLPVDRDLVCELELHDSNVSARYGDFQGGVLKASLCEAGPRFKGRISLGLSRSDWTELLVDPKQLEALENSTSHRLQPSWAKQSWRAHLQGRPLPELGITLNLSRTHSLIQLRGYAASMNPGDSSLQDKQQSRNQQDAVVKFDWRPRPDVHAWLTLRQQPSRQRYFIQNSRNSDFDLDDSGHALSGGFSHSLGALRLRHDLSETLMRDSRRSDAPYLRTWSWSEDKNWGDKSRGTTASSVEGSWGNIDSEQKTLAYALQADLSEAWLALGAGHRFSAGLDLRQRSGSYLRRNDHHVYLPADLVAARGCSAPDGRIDSDSCSLAPSARLPKSGQMFRARDLYRQGGFEVQAGQYALWLEDAMRWQRLELRAGLRAGRDELAGAATFSPRLAGSWRLDEAGLGRLNFGLNRYHGRSFFAAALQEKRETLRLTQTRGADWSWVDGAAAKPSNRLEDVDVPYDDELMLGAEQRFGSLQLGGKWVHRESRRQLTRSRLPDSSEQYASNRPYVYTNLGRGSSDTVSLELSGQREQRWLAGLHSWSLGLNRSRVRSNHNEYQDALSDSEADELVSFRSQIMRRSELPASNYNRPWTARFSLSSRWPASGWSLSQFLRWQGGYRKIAATGKTVPHGEQMLEVLDETDFPATVSWDLNLRWQAGVGRHRPFVALSVENLSNRRNAINNSGGTALYEHGRSASLQAGYEF